MQGRLISEIRMTVPQRLLLWSQTLVEVTLHTFVRGKIDLPRENLPEFTRGKFISGFIFLKVKRALRKVTSRYLQWIDRIKFHAA